jgi:hypothetical protein
MRVLQRGSLPVILQVRFWVRMALIFRHCQIGETQKSSMAGGEGGNSRSFCDMLFFVRTANAMQPYTAAAFDTIIYY